MSAPPVRQVVLNCAKKTRWPDEMSSRAGAMSSIERFGGVDRLWIYRCPFCRGWHLSRNNAGRKWMVTKDNPVHE